MKKSILAGLAIFAVLVLIGACSKKTASEKSNAKLVLKVLHYMDMTAANSASESVDIWDAFSKANPDIIIEREDLFNEPFHQKIEAYMAIDKLPDVMYAWPSGRFAALHEKKLLKDLLPLLKKDNLEGAYIPAAAAPQIAGYLGELPLGITQTHVMYVNNAVLKDAGLKAATTYDELKAQVPILRAKGYDTLLMANAEAWVMQSCLFSVLAGRFCGDAWAEKIISGSEKFTSESFVNALRFVKTLYDDKVLSQNTLAIGYGDVIGLFASGKSAYYIDGDWRQGAFITDKSTGQALISPEKQASDISLQVFPAINGTKYNDSTSVVVSTGFAINSAIPAGSAKEEAAWRLVKWLTGKESESWMLERGALATPSRTDIDIASLNLEPLQKQIASFAAKYSRTTDVFDSKFTGEVYEPLNTGLQELGMGTKTPEKLAEELQKAFENWKASKN